MQTDSIFTKIIQGEVPSYKVYEDEMTFAFLDIHPIQPGQVLVIPKQQVAYVWDLDDATYMALMRTAKKVAHRLREVFSDKTHVAMLVEGLDVAHAHLKLFAFSSDDEFHHRPDMSANPDYPQLEALAKRIAFE